MKAARRILKIHLTFDYICPERRWWLRRIGPDPNDVGLPPDRCRFSNLPVVSVCSFQMVP